MVEVIVISENEDSKYKDRTGLNTNLHFTLNHSADYFSLSLCVILSSSSSAIGTIQPDYTNTFSIIKTNVEDFTLLKQFRTGP